MTPVGRTTGYHHAETVGPNRGVLGCSEQFLACGCRPVGLWPESARSLVCRWCRCWRQPRASQRVRPPKSEAAVYIDKAEIVAKLRADGLDDRAAWVDRDLPNRLDTAKHLTLLRRLGIDVSTLTDVGSASQD